MSPYLMIRLQPNTPARNVECYFLPLRDWQFTGRRSMESDVPSRTLSRARFVQVVSSTCGHPNGLFNTFGIAPTGAWIVLWPACNRKDTARLYFRNTSPRSRGFLPHEGIMAHFFLYLMNVIASAYENDYEFARPTVRQGTFGLLSVRPCRT